MRWKTRLCIIGVVGFALVNATRSAGQTAEEIPDHILPLSIVASEMSVAASGNQEWLLRLREEGWIEQQKEEIEQQKEELERPSGLKVYVWDRTIDGTTQRFVAFKPSMSLRDWQTDVQQQFNGPDVVQQYLNAKSFMEKQIAIKDRNPQMRLAMTGWSLAGGIAQDISLETGIESFVFNSAPLSTSTRAKIEELKRGKDRFAQAAVGRDTIWNFESTVDPVSTLGVRGASVPWARWLDATGAQYGHLVPVPPVSPVGGLFSENSPHAVTLIRDSLVAIEQKKSQPVASIWTNVITGPSGLSDARMMSSMAGNGKRVVVAGTGPVAQELVSRMSNRLGAENVAWIRDYSDDADLQTAARGFHADRILGVQSTAPVPAFHSSGPEMHRPEEIRKRPPQTFQPPPPCPPGTPGCGGNMAGVSRGPEDNFRQSLVGNLPRTGSVGGVMLSGTADVLQGATAMCGTESPLTGGNFSLIFQGANGEIDLPSLRRFVTALWATYFTSNGPGISIDPIGRFTDRHAVRYIGRVVNSDLGRVMRETDYQMKSWAVGTSRPDIPNWLTPEEIGIRNGTVHVGAPSRFWFVPEKMQFSKADNALLFDSGMMRVKTEYLFSGKGDKNPENEEWAEQFTKRYNEIAQHYPVFDELFEYAKLVSLAKYLKERRVPLLWFLLANREMVLTEDSPGTVKAFAKKSDYLEEVQIAGGVDLSQGPSDGSYVVDAELLKALAEARRNSPPPETSESRSSTEPMEIVQRANESLTVTPSQTVVISDSRSPEDAFATDLGVRLDGGPNLEIARYRRTDFAQVATFGHDWHLMIPYAIKPGSEARRSFAEAVVPETMTLQNLLTGREESLHFDTDRYGIAGYIPEHPETALNIGLFFLSNRTFRLVDKLGCEFQFDEAGRLTDMNLAPNYQVSYQYAQKKINWRNFDTAPFRLEPEGTDRVPVQNVTVPKRLRLFDSATGKEEVFAFDTSDSSKTARYVPANFDHSENSFVALMTDGSFVLKQKSGGEIAFDTGGRFTHMVVDILEKMIQKPYEVRFEYEVFQGQYRMVAARVFDQKTDKVLHEVAYEYSPNGNLSGALVASAK